MPPSLPRAVRLANNEEKKKSKALYKGYRDLRMKVEAAGDGEEEEGGRGKVRTLSTHPPNGVRGGGIDPRIGPMA
eukprot:63793-Pyramimonas_sp.AAC.1